MSESHWDKCVAHVTAHARGLAEAAAKKRLNPHRIPVLLRTYVDQPAYYPEWRDALVGLAMASIATGDKP